MDSKENSKKVRFVNPFVKALTDAVHTARVELYEDVEDVTPKRTASAKISVQRVWMVHSEERVVD